MRNYDLGYVHRLTRLDPAQQQRLLRRFANLPQVLQCYVTERQRELSMAWRNEIRKNKGGVAGGICVYDPRQIAENMLCGLLCAIAEVERLAHAEQRGRNLSDEQLELSAWIHGELTKSRQKAKSKAKTQAMILANFGRLLMLREKGLSFDEIARNDPVFRVTSKQYLNKVYLAETARLQVLDNLTSAGKEDPKVPRHRQ